MGCLESARRGGFRKNIICQVGGKIDDFRWSKKLSAPSTEQWYCQLSPFPNPPPFFGGALLTPFPPVESPPPHARHSAAHGVSAVVVPRRATNTGTKRSIRMSGAVQVTAGPLVCWPMFVTLQRFGPNRSGCPQRSAQARSTPKPLPRAPELSPKSRWGGGVLA